MKRHWPTIILSIVGLFIAIICYAPSFWWGWQGLQIHDWPRTHGTVESVQIDPSNTSVPGHQEEEGQNPYRACFVAYTYWADGMQYHGTIQESLHKSGLNPEFWEQFPREFKPGRDVVVRYSPANYGDSFLPEIAKIFMWKEFYEGFFNFVWSCSLVVIVYFLFRSKKGFKIKKKKDKGLPPPVS